MRQDKAPLGQDESEQFWSCMHSMSASHACEGQQKVPAQLRIADLGTSR